MYKMILEAHRGVGTEFPENTLSAFRAAAEQGYGMIEMDTKFTRDNHCVLLHDRTVNRTGRRNDGSAIAEKLPVAELTLAEALELDFGCWKSPLFKGEKIPTLEQVLDMALAYKIPLKFDNVLWSHTPEQRDIFFETIIAIKAAHLTEITCGDITAIQTVRGRLPESKIHYDGPVTSDTITAISAAVPKDMLTVWLRFDNKITSWCKNPPVNKELSDIVKKHGRLGVWLLTEPEELRDAIEIYHADIVETDGKLKPTNMKG